VLPVILREAADEDAATLVALMHAAFEEYRGVLDPPSAAHDETVDVVRNKLRDGGHAVVAEVQGQAVGFAFYHQQDDDLYFGRLSVLEQYRRQGIGRALIDYVERKAIEQGLRGVRLGVRVQLPHLMARYERLGYRVAKYMTHAGYTQPTWVAMEKIVTRDH
jgi:ribosomal protein S18 acetylase RimI-like enzyme